MRVPFACLAILLAACSSTEEPNNSSQDAGRFSCANLPAERIDTIEFNPKTDCGSSDAGSADAGTSDGGASDGGTQCNCETLCKQRIGSEFVSCKFLTQNRADCAVKQSCPDQ